MNKYEAMFIVRPDLAEDERKVLFSQISDAVNKNGGKVAEAVVWSERKKFCFPIKKYQDGVYYLMNFNSNPLAISELRNTYKLNENILRALIIRLG